MQFCQEEEGLPQHSATLKKEAPRQVPWPMEVKQVGDTVTTNTFLHPSLNPNLGQETNVNGKHLK